MSAISAADLHKAVEAVWTEHLDDTFKSFWAGADVQLFPSLYDSEAAPGAPLPYCVYQFDPGIVESRSTASGAPVGPEQRRRIDDIPLIFNIHARAASQDQQVVTAKKIAQSLARSVIGKFGGHPSEVPVDLALDTVGILLIQYQNDYGGRTGDEEYSWMINYVVKIDNPVAA